jgi:SAM-dependent methyltransferase
MTEVGRGGGELPARTRDAWVAFRPGFEWVERCDLCGGTEFATRARYPEYLLFTGETFRLVACRGCDLQFLDPRPGPALIGEYYPADYTAHQIEPRPLRGWQREVGGEGARPGGPLTRLRLHLRQAMHWYTIPAHEGGGRYLDIGCGSGKLLDTMRQLGWETHGVEVATAAAERARAAGHRVQAATAEEFEVEAEHFQAVSMCHVLEHTHSPTRALANVHRALAPGGRFFLTVPNIKSVQARLLGRYWWSSDAPRHIYQFDRATVRAYLERAGFRDIEVTTRTGSTSWARGLRHLVNGVLPTRLSRDPAWLVELCELPVVFSALFKFFGVGGELRVSCRK